MKINGVDYIPTETDIQYGKWMEELRNLANKLGEKTLDLPSPWINRTIRQSVLEDELWIDRCYNPYRLPREVLDEAVKQSESYNLTGVT